MGHSHILVDHEGEQMFLVLDVSEGDYSGRSFWGFHVVNVKLLEVAGDDVSSSFGCFEPVIIAFGLLEGSEGRAVRLFSGFIEVNILRFLLDENFSAGDVSVDPAGILEFNLFLKRYESERFVDSEKLKELCPERLSVANFVAFAVPVVEERHEESSLKECV